MRKQLYLDIQQAVKTITKDDKPLFKHVDLWNQNVQFLEEDRHWNRPALFVEFMPIAWETNGQKVQDATVDIHLHIVTDWFGGSPDDNHRQQEALSYLDLPDIVLAKLQNMKLTLSGSLTRTQSIINHNHERILDSVEIYQARIRDNSAMIVNQRVEATAVTLKITTDETQV